MKIQIEDIYRYIEWKERVNSCNLEDIEVIDERGEVVKVHTTDVKNWKFTGLNNMDFLLTLLVRK